MREFLKLLALPEMRTFWILSPFIAALFVASIIYFPPVIAFAGAGALVVMAGIVFGSIVQSAKVYRDASEKKNQLESIILSMKDALIVYDQQFIVMFFNPAAEKLFGLSKDSVVGRSFSPRDAEKESTQRLAQVIFPTLSPTMVPRSKAGEYPQIVDLTFENPYLELRTATSLIRNDKGEVVGFMKVANNRTQEVSLLKSKSEFITVASHQLRTPITNIGWVLESTLASGTIKDEGLIELLKNASISAGQLKRIVEDLLNISKIEEGRFGYNFVETDIVEFLDSMLSEALPQARAVGISLYFDRPEGKLPKAMIDPPKLGMAITNIIDNAIRYNVENGKITVAVSMQEEKPYIQVSVRDTGVGISASDVEKLFTKFFRAENAVRAQADGSGLGLYIMKNIIQSHGGTAWVESELNRGTTFYFTVPTDPSLIPPRESSVAY